MTHGVVTDGGSKRTTIILVRHGARFDYANKLAWKNLCNQYGHEACDPPLSSLGHSQARETAAELAKRHPAIDCLLVSPYLRVLQTAQPLAHALQLPLCVENALAEFRHNPDKLPAVGARVAYFPEINGTYEQVLGSFNVDSGTGDEPKLEYMRRMLLLAQELPRRHPGKTIVCYSHAASLALVAALTRSSGLADVGRFAPCGIFELASDDLGDTWKVLRSGEDNSEYVTTNDPTTYPWGFTSQAARAVDQSQTAWTEAQKLGPTTEGTARKTPDVSQGTSCFSWFCGKGLTRMLAKGQ